MNTLLSTDLHYILKYTSSVWDELKNARLFITGGTGFIGSWFLETLAFANTHLNLNLSAVILTRDKAAFIKKVPHLAHDPAIQFISGDVRDFIFPCESFSHIVHGATEASAQLNQEQPLVMLDTILQGTRHTLEFAQQARAKKFLLLSSGAVYGKQAHDIEQLDESYEGAPDSLNPASAYAIGKRTAEHICVLHGMQSHMQIKMARCFAFVGPYLPLNKHFAIGNFIRDGLAGNEIKIHGDGSPFRSYQYAADLIIWLLHILCFGQCNTPYNVGSDEPISILDLAHLVSDAFHPQPSVSIAKTRQEHMLPERYIPSIQRAQKDLGLINRISLREAIQKTIHWVRHPSRSLSLNVG